MYLQTKIIITHHTPGGEIVVNAVLMRGRSFGCFDTGCVETHGHVMGDGVIITSVTQHHHNQLPSESLTSPQVISQGAEISPHSGKNVICTFFIHPSNLFN